MLLVSIKLIVLGIFLKIFDGQNCKFESGSDRNLNITESQVLHLGLCINFIKKIMISEKNSQFQIFFFPLLLGLSVLHGFEIRWRYHTCILLGRNLKFLSCPSWLGVDLQKYL